MAERFEPAFLATTVVLGDSKEQALEALGAAGAVHAAELVRGLAATSREARARALSAALAQVAAAIEEEVPR